MFSIVKSSFRGIILIAYEVIKSAKWKTMFFVLLTPFEYFYFGHLEPQCWSILFLLSTSLSLQKSGHTILHLLLKRQEKERLVLHLTTRPVYQGMSKYPRLGWCYNICDSIKICSPSSEKMRKETLSFKFDNQTSSYQGMSKYQSLLCCNICDFIKFCLKIWIIFVEWETE